MDRIKPIDIERTRFGKAILGYNREEVDELLQRLASEVETLLKEQLRAQEQLDLQSKELDVYRAQESLLKEALILAQKTADETRASAHKEAELIVQETLQKTDRLSHDLQAKISDLRWEVERLRLEKQKFLRGFRAMLEEYLAEVDQADVSEAIRAENNDPGDGPHAKVV
ncbi:MAG: DivIVA domain-containing protein [Fimbriimonadaceae bacterium]